LKCGASTEKFVGAGDATKSTVVISIFVVFKGK